MTTYVRKARGVQVDGRAKVMTTVKPPTAASLIQDGWQSAQEMAPPGRWRERCFCWDGDGIPCQRGLSGSFSKM